MICEVDYLETWTDAQGQYRELEQEKEGNQHNYRSGIYEEAPHK